MDELITINPWWKEKEVTKELTKEYRRNAFNKVWGLIDYRQILIIKGLRRVGKSTLLFQMIDKLIKKN